MNLEKLCQSILSMIQMVRERKDLNIPLKLVLTIPENGLVASEMAKEYSNGKTALYIEVTGKTTELMVKENLFTSMETYTKVNG